MSEYANESPTEFAGVSGLVIPCWMCGKFVQFAHADEHWKTFKKRGPTCDSCHAENERRRTMGWGDCGDDSKGRPIGYGFVAECDHEGCDTLIDRGLAYACGDMHGEGDDYCEKYFCHDKGHLIHTSKGVRCIECAAPILAEEDDECVE